MKYTNELIRKANYRSLTFNYSVFLRMVFVFNFVSFDILLFHKNSTKCIQLYIPNFLFWTGWQCILFLNSKVKYNFKPNKYISLHFAPGNLKCIEIIFNSKTFLISSAIRLKKKSKCLFDKLQVKHNYCTLHHIIFTTLEKFSRRFLVPLMYKNMTQVIFN